MKKLCLIFLTAIVTTGSCQIQKDVTLSYIKIAPIGNSDAPRMLLYISMTRIDSITKFDPNENVGFVEKILTNEKTLRTIVMFISTYKYNPNQKWNPLESGWCNILLYDQHSLLVSRDLNLAESRKFLNGLIEILEEKELDQKVKDAIDEDILKPIEY